MRPAHLWSAAQRPQWWLFYMWLGCFALVSYIQLLYFPELVVWAIRTGFEDGLRQAFSPDAGWP